LDDKDRRRLYNPKPGKPEIIDVPTTNYIMADGEGHPQGSEQFQSAMQALYTLAYTLKFALKKADPTRDFHVGPLEGLWWTDDMQEFSMGAKGAWKWTVMMPLPDHITTAEVAAAKEEIKRKKGVDLAQSVRFEPFVEGLSAQVMHLGPYAAEAPTIETLHNFIRDSGYVLAGKHHEIYMGDPRTAAPEKLKTIIRQPVAKPSS
jgi:hypothetical protein